MRRTVSLFLTGCALLALPACAEAKPPKKPLAVFLGDSYTGGTSIGGEGAANYSKDVGKALGWKVTANGEGGTGYTVAPDGKFTFGERVNFVATLKPDVVVVFGGRNDLGPVGDAPAKVFKRLRSKLPKAKIIAVGPAWTTEPVPAVVTENDAAIKAAAGKAKKVRFVSALERRWFLDADAALIGSDKVHPTDEGHDYLAEQMTDAFVDLGFKRRG